MADLRLKILPVLRKLGGRATAGDVAAGTGFPLDEVARELWKLVGDLRGNVDVDDKGEILFKFPPDLRRPTDPERRAAFWRALYAAFKLGFKVCILAVLAVYLVLFAVIALLLAAAALAAALKDGDSRDSDSGSWMPDLGWLWFLPDSGPSYSRWERNRGLSYREPRRRKAPWEAVFAFVFGEEEPRDPTAAEREALAFVREHKGVLTTTDLVSLTAADFDEAGRQAGQLSARHGGSLELTGNGTLLYRFEQLAVTAGKREGVWEYAWQKLEAPRPANRNGAGANLLIGGVNAFNLAWSGWFALSPTGLQDAIGYIAVNLFEAAPPEMGAVPRLVLGGAPFLFSLVFFAVPVIRMLFLGVENGRREERNRWRRLAERVFREAVWTKKETPVKGLEEAARAWHGVTVPGFADEGWIFPRLRQETEEARQARKGVDLARLRIGRVVFATQDQPNVR